MSYPSRYTSFANAPSSTFGLVKAGQGSLRSLNVTALGVTDTYLMLFDLNRSPLAGDIRRLVFPVAIGTYLEVGLDQLTEDGFTFENGLAWAISSTPINYTPVSGDPATVTLFFE